MPRIIDMPIGELCFMYEKREDDEHRETYYTRISETEYLHHGCIQGVEQFIGSTGIRYSSLNKEGFRYPIIPYLPVRELRTSLWM